MEDFLNFIKKKKVICIIGTFIFAILICFSFYISEVTAEEAYTCPKIEADLTSDEELNVVVVDIKGAILNPGVYRVSKNTIIQDVISLAGGLTKNADTSNLNLGKKVTDEMVITVFTKEEILKMELDKEPIKEDQVRNDEIGENKKLISLNTATLEELTTLPGIGEAKAKIIIAYREHCGNFKKKEELKNIKGIGEAVYAKLENYITV